MEEKNELNEEEQDKNIHSDSLKRRAAEYDRKHYLSCVKYRENGRLFDANDYDNGYNGERARNNH